MATTRIAIPTYGETDITATFAKTTYTLTWTVTGSGTVAPASGTTYVLDDALAVTATPAAGWQFLNWTGAGAANLVDANSASTTIINPTTANTDLVANFAKTTYSLTWTVNGSGTVAPPSGTNYVLDTALAVTATPAAGWEFVNWTGAGAANLVDANSASTTIINPTASNTDLVANFAKTTYTLTWTVTGSGTVVPASGTTYVLDDALAVTATPAAGWQFVNWTGAGAANLVDASSASTTIINPTTVNTDLVANFIHIEYTLTVNRTGGMGTGVVTVSPSQATYHYGDVVTITAGVGAGETFGNWSGDLSGNNNPETLTISDNHTVTANYNHIEYNLNITISEPFPGGGTAVTKSPDQATYHYGDVVSLTAVTGTGEIFTGWSGDVVDTANPISITINSDKNITATFDKQTVTLDMQVSFLEPGAFGTVTPDIGSHTYLWGDTVSVTATPDVASTDFVGWTPNVVGGVVTMNGNQTVIATFDLRTFTVTFQAGSDGTLDDGTTTADTIVQNVRWGQNSTVVTGIADAHYHFLEWVNDADGTVMGTDPSLQAIHVIEDLVFTGNFEIDKFTLTFTGGNFGDVEVGGTSYPDQYQEIVDWNSSSNLVTALPDDQNQFQGWTGTGGFTSSDLAIQINNVDQDMVITYDTVPDINGCSTDVTYSNPSGFDAAHFNRVNVDVVAGNFKLNTGNQAIDPDSIIVPFKQDVYVTFLYEGAGFKQTDFGWIFASEGKGGVKHEIYANINDNDKNGILDGMTDRNGDGVIDRHDNKVYLGTIDGGTEIVFYLDARDNGCGSWCGDIFFTKRAWNDHDPHWRCEDDTTGIAREIRLYQDGGEGDTNCYAYVPACGAGVHTQGWMDAAARTRLNADFGFNFRAPVAGDPPGFNTECIDEPNGTPSTHAIVGAPDETPFAWVIGFDDTT
ncbi:MAG: hypothetical protein WBM36_10870, partial [Lysobacterales bacterium]